jgi:hypothetical protein
MSVNADPKLARLDGKQTVGTQRPDVGGEQLNHSKESEKVQQLNLLLRLERDQQRMKCSPDSNNQPSRTYDKQTDVSGLNLLSNKRKRELRLRMDRWNQRKKQRGSSSSTSCFGSRGIGGTNGTAANELLAGIDTRTN